MAKGISVIIACFNSEKVIQKTLEHLQSQINCIDIPWEVVLVDNNCTDSTSKIAFETWKKNEVVPLTIVSEKKVGEANARRAGFRNAKYDILSIVDDDNRVSKNWISEIFGYFQDSKTGLVGCAGLGDFEENPPIWFKEQQHAFAVGQLYEGDFVNITQDAIVPGAGMSLRKSIVDHLESIGWQPFLQGRVGNRQSAGADSELCYMTRHLGYNIYYSNRLKFNHFTAKHRITWERLENMTRGFGESDVYTLPYKILYEELKGNKNILNTLRKKWWFNYFGKKIALVKNDPFFFINKTKKNSNQLAYIRNTAFCETIYSERKRFEDSFEKLKNIKPLINN